jgi:uncharacterized membrane protein
VPLVAAGAAGAAVIALDLMLSRPGSTADFVRFLGRFHPLVVHLPIGFLLLIAFAEALSLAPRFRARVDPALGVLWPALVASGVLAFGLGLLLAHDGGYPLKLVTWHRRLTLLAVLAIAACYPLWTRVERGVVPRVAYRAWLGVTVGVISVGAHFGGSLSRGENYLFQFAPGFVQRLAGVAPAEPAAASSAAANTAPPTAEPLVFRDVVQPILKAHCVECHGPDKTKGGLRLDSFAALSKGGEHSPEFVAGDAAHSHLVQRMLLPKSDDDHMPPEGKSEPTAADVELIRWWIDRGATETLRVRDTLVPDGARALLIHSTTLGPSATALPPVDDSSFDKASEKVPVTAPATAAPLAQDAAAGAKSSGSRFASAIAPLFRDRCGQCHGAQKQKGHLRTDSLSAVLRGGKGGAGIVAGAGARGTVLERIRLASSDDKHMPPNDQPQLTSNQIALIAWWAEAGATTDVPASAAPPALVAAARVRRAAPSAVAMNAARAPDHATQSQTSLGRVESSNASTASNASAANSTGEHDALPAVELPAHIAFYRDVVAPILASRCGGCHGGSDPDGDMRIDDHQKLIASGAIVAGDPGKSEIMARLRTPAGKSGHMPPTHSPQPEASEVDAIELWIARGADVDGELESASLSGPVAGLAARMLAKNTNAAPSGATNAPGSAGTSEPAARMPPNAPVHAGCASCGVGSQKARTPLTWLALGLALFAVARRALRARA